MSVSCLVTVYYPTENHVLNIKAFSCQADRVFVCDNTPDADNGTMFSEIAENVVYIANRKNLGLSAAFNTVLKDEKYRFSDEDFIIFFDQDSKLNDRHILALISCYEKIERVCGTVGALGPSYFDSTVGKKRIARVRVKTAVDNVFEVPQVITSSLLTRYKNLRKINFWNEDVFLDFADWDLCFRLRAAGLKVYVTLDVLMEHTLGRGFQKFGFVRKHFDSPVREYYQTREALKLYRKKYVPMKFRVKFFLIVFLRPLVDTHFLPEGGERKNFIRKAKFDFKRGLNSAFEGR